ncbi:MAG: HAMP domain-containing histidine kinase [Deltaproteobacteria bacterium]|nr:HAMP domain-containing histidine kinase [Deltaproteobacteria bacterium]
MNFTSPLSLGRALRLATVAVAVLVTVVAGALVGLTNLLHETSRTLRASVATVRQAEEARVDLLVQERSGDPLTRADAEADIRRNLHDGFESFRSPGQRAALDEASAAVDAYFASAHTVPADARVAETRFQAAYVALDALVNQSIDSANQAERAGARWNRLGDVLGYTGGGLILLLTVLAAVWVQRAVVGPVGQLSRAVERTQVGDFTARAPVQGAAEVQDVARCFNEVVAMHARRRVDRLSYLASVAHELREPLSALQLSASVLGGDETIPPEESQRRLLALVRRQVTRLNRMVGDFLETVRIESGHLVLLTELDDLRTLVLEAAGRFRSVSAHHTITAQVPTGPVLARVDPVRLEETLNNLVSSAIKRSPLGGQVLLSLRATDDEAAVRVTDEGPGLAQEELEHVWDRFRGVSISSEPYAGVGLGLSIVRRIVEAHGGQVEAESLPVQGCAFGFRLPRSWHRNIEPEPLHDGLPSPAPDGPGG